jgi:hypothetical protein
MFQALLAHPQEELNKQHLVYCVRVMSAGGTRVEVELVSISVAMSEIYRDVIT